MLGLALGFGFSVYSFTVAVDFPGTDWAQRPLTFKSLTFTMLNIGGRGNAGSLSTKKKR